MNTNIQNFVCESCEETANKGFNTHFVQEDSLFIGASFYAITKTAVTVGETVPVDMNKFKIVRKELEDGKYCNVLRSRATE